MKTVTLPVHDRPQYLRKTLQALKYCWDPDYRLIVGMEPGCPEVEKMIHDIKFANPTVLINQSVLGIEGNMGRILEYAFDQGSAFNVHIEDDVTVTPDAFDLIDWYRKRGDCGDLALCLFGLEKDGGDPGTLVRKRYFCPWGWCCFPSSWPIIEKALKHPPGWDVGVNALIQAHGLEALHPLLSRSLHIGETGVHQRAAEYHRQFDGTVLSRDYYGPFEIIQREAP